MPDRLIYEPLRRSHTDELAAVLLNQQVYSYISERPPTADEYRKRVEHILRGPPASKPGLSFENYAVRLAPTGEVIGTLEATTHDALVEVAFLFGPQHWGKGYATEGLSWFSALLLGRSATTGLWATTHPRNVRSVTLLDRCGYTQVEPRQAPRLLSYEEGDLVFSLSSAA
jgi:RimJ/RimL family protein N-acetyltransferase